MIFWLVREWGLERELEWVRYYNDSIGSSPSRTIAGLRTFDQKVILIAGGYDKQVPFDALGEEIIKRVKVLILTGDTADKIQCAVEHAAGFAPGEPEVFRVSDLNSAVAKAAELARAGDAVVLSPACAAFDQFKNFMERGDTFKAIVRQLKGM